jgi:hypothetical protein
LVTMEICLVPHKVPLAGKSNHGTTRYQTAPSDKQKH